MTTITSKSGRSVDLVVKGGNVVATVAELPGSFEVELVDGEIRNFVGRPIVIQVDAANLAIATELFDAAAARLNASISADAAYDANYARVLRAMEG